MNKGEFSSPGFEAFRISMEPDIFGPSSIGPKARQRPAQENSQFLREFSYPRGSGNEPEVDLKSPLATADKHMAPFRGCRTVANRTTRRLRAAGQNSLEDENSLFL
jgi:hypothetical protein